MSTGLLSQVQDSASLPREIGVTLPDGANPTLGTHLYDGAGDSDPSV